MGGTVRHRPKSILLAEAWLNHRAALLADFHRAYGFMPRLTDFAMFVRGEHGNIAYFHCWRLMAELLRDRTSRLYSSLAGWTYSPTGAEIAQWDRLELEGRLKRKGWRPWLDERHAATRRRAMSRRTQADRQASRQRLRDRFNFTDQT